MADDFNFSDIKYWQEQRDRAERERARDEAILRSIGNGLIVSDQKGIITLINKAACEMLGWRVEEAVGKPMSEVAFITSEEENPTPFYKDPSVLASLVGPKMTTSYYLVRKDKSRFPAAITTSSVILNKEVLGAVIVFSDITVEKEIERAKSDFVAIASHQLRTPLGSMRWNLEMLLGGDYGPVSDEVREVLQLILESSERLVKLVSDLLSVSRIDQGRLVEEAEPVAIMEVVNSILSEIRGEADKRSLEIVLDGPENVIPKIVLPPKGFREAVENLLSNAIKYSNPGGMVKLAVKGEQQKVRISVEDSGIGIPGGSQKRVFSKFFRADNAIKSNTEGTGLGLFVVKSYVESWGGKIWFESEQGKGTTFFVEIPFDSKPVTK